MDKLTFEPKTGTGVGEVGPGDPAVTDRAFGQALVEAGERVLGGRECRFYLPISNRKK